VIEQQGVLRVGTPKIGCGADQVYAQGRQCADNWRPSCLALQSSPEGWQATPYWSVVENTRVAGGRVAQRHVLYEINDTQELALRRSISVSEDGRAQPRTLSLFPEDRCEGLLGDASVVRVKLSELRLRRPRQWGACWLALFLWRELQLDQFWCKRLGVSRKGTRWDQVLFVLVAYRLLAPGSEWRLHREWFQRSALADLLGEDAGLAEIHKLYRGHDRLLVHKQAVFDHLVVCSTSATTCCSTI
jgi:hypothetical protein